MKAMRRWLLRRLQPCAAMVPLMSQSLDRQLALSERLKLRLHLLVCVWCTRYLNQMKFLKTLLRSTPIPDESGPTSVALTAEARERISKSLNRK